MFFGSLIRPKRRLQVLVTARYCAHLTFDQRAHCREKASTLPCLCCASTSCSKNGFEIVPWVSTVSPWRSATSTSSGRLGMFLPVMSSLKCEIVIGISCSQKTCRGGSSLEASVGHSMYKRPLGFNRLAHHDTTCIGSVMCSMK